MAEFTFYARGDNSTANNASLNTQGLSTTPVTELTFFPADGGDVSLEYNNGDPDPDTLVLVNGYETSFTVEFTGELPLTNKYADINGVDLRGAEIIVISVTLESGEVQRFWFVSDQILSPETVAEFPNGASNLINVQDPPGPVAICFASGTPIDTPDGPRAVETLRPGDLVSTDLGPRPILWVGSTDLSPRVLSREKGLRPIRFRAGCLGEDMPRQDITLSPNHRIVANGALIELSLGQPTVLVAAKHLTDLPGIDAECPEGGVTYHHILLGSHRLLETAGLKSESFDPGPVGMATLTASAFAEVSAILRDRDPAGDPDIDLPILKKFEARLLLPAMA